MVGVGFATTQLIPLEMLHPGEEGQIEEIDGDVSLVHRLAEMGVCVGNRVRMVKSGPACIIQMGHQRLSFRADGQINIWVALPARGTGTLP